MTFFDVNGPWRVQFPDGSGATSEIILISLASLHKHENFDVKHFSGKANYHNAILISRKDINPEQRIFLDLGRVEVVAEVKVNGKEVELLWKEPFIADITTAIRKGINDLVIQVANRWSNRLIGDKFLPVEND
jgi:maltoporin